MTFTKVARLGTAAVLVVGLGMARNAEAAYIATLEQVGSNVVATGSGSLDLAALSGPDSGAAELAGINPSGGAIVLGPTQSTSVSYYTGFIGPASFGSGVGSLADSGGGAIVGIGDGAGLIIVPTSYVSGAALATSTDTWDDTTLAALGVTDGTYTWIWGSGATADSFTLDVGATPVPEPASLAIFITALAGLGFLHRRKREAV